MPALELEGEEEEDVVVPVLLLLHVVREGAGPDLLRGEKTFGVSKLDGL